MSLAMAGLKLCSALTNNVKTVFTNRLHLMAPQMSNKIDTENILKSHNIPAKPKRPFTAYFRFMMDKREEITKNNPKVNNQDVLKQIAVEWKSLGEESKAKYEEMANKDKEQYIEDLANFTSKLTPEQEEILHQVDADKRKNRQKRRLKKEINTLGKPKRPVTSFGLFMQSQMSPDKKLSQVMQTLKEEWAKLLPSEKEKYQIQYQKNREKFEIELQKWEKAMIADGKTYLVREKTLKEQGTMVKKLKKEKTE